MELVFLTSDDIVKAHYALHGNIEPEVNTSALIKVCIIVSRTYAGVEASLETVFQVAADYGVQLAQSNWSQKPDKAAETAFLICLLQLNRYGIAMKCDNQSLFNMMRDTWTKPDKLAAHMFNKYLNDIAAKNNDYCRSNLQHNLAARAMCEPRNCNELMDIGARLSETFNVVSVEPGCT